MSDGATLILIVVLCIIAILIGLWNALKIREVHLVTNSRLDQLLTSSISEAHAAGVEHERARELARLAAVNRERERSS